MKVEIVQREGVRYGECCDICMRHDALTFDLILNLADEELSDDGISNICQRCLTEISRAVNAMTE